MREMEEGEYAPDANNALRRLNDVTRKWEQRCPPRLQRQQGQELNNDALCADASQPAPTPMQQQESPSKRCSSS